MNRYEYKQYISRKMIEEIYPQMYGKYAKIIFNKKNGELRKIEGIVKGYPTRLYIQEGEKLKRIGLRYITSIHYLAETKDGYQTWINDCDWVEYIKI